MREQRLEEAGGGKGSRLRVAPDEGPGLLVSSVAGVRAVVPQLRGSSPSEVLDWRLTPCHSPGFNPCGEPGVAAAWVLSNRLLKTFTVATNEFIGHGKEKAEYQSNGKVYPVGRDTAL